MEIEIRIAAACLWGLGRSLKKVFTVMEVFYISIGILDKQMHIFVKVIESCI